MDREFTRTSVTVDEAVAILLGRVDGPIWFRPLNDDLSQEEQDLHDSLAYSLQEDLENDKEQAESDLAEAEFDKMDECAVEARCEAVRKATADRALAKTYLCAIEDELSKGAMSALRVDVKRTNSHQTYITLTSFSAWAEEKKFRGPVLERVPTIIQPSVEADADNTGLGGAERNTRQKVGNPKQRRFDTLGAELDEILSKEPNLLPSQVMVKLRSRIGQPGTCIIENVGDGIKWENEAGTVKIMNARSLAERIRVWKSRSMTG